MSDLSTRYGSPRPARRALLVGGVVVLAAGFLGWLLWVMLVHGRPMAQSDLVSFDVTGEHAAEATITVVRRSSDVEASCLLQAQAADHTVVGELLVPVGPELPATATLTRTVRTEREATTVALLGCTAEGQRNRR